MNNLIFLIRYNLREVRSFIYFNLRILVLKLQYKTNIQFFRLRLFWY